MSVARDLGTVCQSVTIVLVVPSKTFPLRWNPDSVLRPPSSGSGVMIDEAGLHVRFASDSGMILRGEQFRADIPLESIMGVRPDQPFIMRDHGFSVLQTSISFNAKWGIGLVKGGRGVWQVNGDTGALLAIDMNPKARGRAMGFPIRIRTLRLGVEGEDELITALGGEREPQPNESDSLSNRLFGGLLAARPSRSHRP